MKDIYKALFTFGLLMWAINPAVRHIDWLFMTVCGLEGVCLVASIVVRDMYYKGHPPEDISASRTSKKPTVSIQASRPV